MNNWAQHVKTFYCFSGFYLSALEFLELHKHRSHFGSGNRRKATLVYLEEREKFTLREDEGLPQGNGEGYRGQMGKITKGERVRLLPRNG